jgi:tRNA(fMet)-specific endonuclease VapC
MHILDTDILTHLHAGNPRVINHLQKIEDSSVCITVITKIELLQGRFDFLLKAATGNELKRAQQWLHLTEELLSQIVVIPFDDAALNQFDRLRRDKKFKKIVHADILIASIALANRATIVARNIRHFRQIPNLDVVNWLA